MLERSSNSPEARPRHPLITPEELADLAEIDRLLDEANAHAMSQDGAAWKPDEGHVSISFGNHWDRDPDEPRKPVAVSIYSYLLGPYRSHDFDNTAQALEVVRQWHRREMAYNYETGEFGTGEEDLYLKIERERREEFERGYAEFERMMENGDAFVVEGTLDEVLGQIDGDEQ